MRVLVGPFSAGRASLLQNDYASGLPSPMAFLGLSDAIGHACGLSRWSVKVLPILHELNPSTGRTKPELALKGKTAAAARFAPGEIQETMIGHVIASVVLDLPQTVDIFQIQRFMASANLAGSPVFPLSQNLRILEIGDQGSDLFASRRGYAFVPSGLGKRIEPVSFGQGETLQDISARLHPVEREKGSGWLVPAAVGYRFLEDPETVPPRTGTRSPDHPHVFAEPAVSIAELVSIRNSRLTDSEGSELESAFWSWTATSTGTFSHPIYRN